MTTVGIRHEQDIGSITYDERDDGTIEFSITFPNKNVRRKLSQYLVAEQEYRTPNSSDVHDDDFIETGRPIDNLDFFERALCEVFSRYGVFVNW